MTTKKNNIDSRYLFQYNQCIVCNKPLLYKKDPIAVVCYHCGIQIKSQVICSEGHFVCDECSRRDVYQIIFDECKRFPGLEPIELANRIMSREKIRIHGPEHHLIVPAVMLTVWSNYKNIDIKTKNELLNEAKNRALRIHDGICASHGTCGGAMGVGLFFSLMLHVHELDKENYGYINRATANTLLRVAKYGGPRCCKRSTYLAILQIRNQLLEDFNIELPIPSKIICHYIHKNKECTHNECLFY